MKLIKQMRIPCLYHSGAPEIMFKLVLNSKIGEIYGAQAIGKKYR